MIHMGKNIVPISEKYSLSITQASEYFGIGQGKLRWIIENHEGADFILRNGAKTQIKRKKFEKFLDGVESI